MAETKNVAEVRMSCDTGLWHCGVMNQLYNRLNIEDTHLLMKCKFGTRIPNLNKLSIVGSPRMPLTVWCARPGQLFEWATGLPSMALLGGECTRTAGRLQPDGRRQTINGIPISWYR